MDSEHSAFAAAQMRHHRFMIFGKKQRYIEVFQCSGEDMSLVLFGGIPPPTAPVSPVGKTLLSPGMLNTPTLLPAPANPSTLTAAAAIPPAGGNPAAATPTAALLPQQAALSWDPISAQVALQMQQAALAQAQAQATFRSQQENIWLMNQLAAQHQLQSHLQQQMQLAALANAQKTQWAEFSGSNTALLSGLPQPQPQPTMTPINTVVTSQASGSVSNKQKPLISSSMYPVVSSALHLPQVSASTTATNPPFVLINIPRFSSPIQSYTPKVTGITSTSTVNQTSIPSVAAAFNMTQNPLLSSPAQYAASSILKRSWEHAFPENISAQSSNKRPYTIGNPATSTAMFSMPPPQQQTAQLPSQPAASAVTFQPAQFFAPT